MKVNGTRASTWLIENVVVAAQLVEPLDEKVELCKGCGEPVAMMCQKGTGWCSQVCQEAAGAPWETEDDPQGTWGVGSDRRAG